MNRRKIGQPFSEPELWYLLYVLACAAAYLGHKNYQIGDVQPANIVISEDGEIQVITNDTFIEMI